MTDFRYKHQVLETLQCFKEKQEQYIFKQMKVMMWLSQSLGQLVKHDLQVLGVTTMMRLGALLTNLDPSIEKNR